MLPVEVWSDDEVWSAAGQRVQAYDPLVGGTSIDDPLVLEFRYGCNELEVGVVVDQRQPVVDCYGGDDQVRHLAFCEPGLG